MADSPNDYPFAPGPVLSCHNKVVGHDAFLEGSVENPAHRVGLDLSVRTPFLLKSCMQHSSKPVERANLLILAVCQQICGLVNPLVARVQKIKVCNLTLNRLLVVTEFVKKWFILALTMASVRD